MPIILKPLFSSKDPTWKTPHEMFQHVVEFAKPYGIGLDPCAGSQNCLPCRRKTSVQEDGLNLNWGGCGLVWVNPPYGREIWQWTQKMKMEAEQGTEIISLLPSRTDTRWFQDVWTADALCFWKGRIRFMGAENFAPFPSVVAYWGRKKVRFTKVFESKGKIISK